MSTFVNQYPLGGETLYVFDDAVWVGPTPVPGAAPYYTRGGGLAGASVIQTAFPGQRGGGQITLGVLMIVFFPIVAMITLTPVGAIVGMFNNAPGWVQGLVTAVLSVAWLALFVWLEIRVWKRPIVHLLNVTGPQINLQATGGYQSVLTSAADAVREQIAMLVTRAS